LICGPVIKMKDYLDFTNLEMFNDPVCKNKIPSGIVPGIKKLIFGLSLIPLVIFRNQYDPKLLISPEFVEKGFLERSIWLCSFIVLNAQKYGFIWYVTEGSCCFCGLAYNGVGEDGKTLLWNRVENINVIKFVFSQNITAVNAAWNMQTGKWLKNYVYLRINPGQKPTLLNTMVTYTTSALWHGLYPGYYMSFMLGAIMTEAQREMRKTFRPYFVDTPLKPLYDLVTLLTTMWFLSYVMFAFLLLDFWLVIQFYNSFYWSGHILGIGVLVYFRVIQPSIFKQKKA